MNLTKKMKTELVQELNLVVDNMQKATKPSEKLYFFSAAYAIANRIFNFECDPELVFLHQVLQVTYNSINTRLNSMAKGQDSTISFPDNLFDRIEELLKDISSVIEQDGHIYLFLEKMANLAYSVTGNGYYLYTKGKLRV